MVTVESDLLAFIDENTEIGSERSHVKDVSSVSQLNFLRLDIVEEVNLKKLRKVAKILFQVLGVGMDVVVRVKTEVERD